MDKRETEPEVQQLGKFLHSFNHESDRGAALVAASMIDSRLREILAAFMIENSVTSDLLNGFNAPLGTFSARTAAALALGLIQENEFREITLVRKIRNEFGHGWQPVSFDAGRAADLTRQLPWLGPAELEEGSTLRSRFNSAVAILLADLMWRTRLVAEQRRALRSWPNTTGMVRAPKPLAQRE